MTTIFKDSVDVLQIDAISTLYSIRYNFWISVKVYNNATESGITYQIKRLLSLLLLNNLKLFNYFSYSPPRKILPVTPITSQKSFKLRSNFLSMTLRAAREYLEGEFYWEF